MDNCQTCLGKQGGVLGNENLWYDPQHPQEYIVVCDYCTVILWDIIHYKGERMSERARIEYLVGVYGKEGAKRRCVEYAHIYFGFLHGLHGRKMQMFYDKMRESIDEFLEFIENGGD